MTNFLPEGFETLQTDKSYINIPKLPEGEYKFRIVTRPVAGWVDWKDKKPYRYRPTEKPEESFDPEKPMKAFWSCYVWDYTREGLYIMEITQMTILKSLIDLGKDEDWGDFTQYDIKIKKSGSGKETEYLVSPVPHKPMAEKIKQALKVKPVNLEALYNGGDPWEDFTDNMELESTATPFANKLEELKETLTSDQINVDDLEAYINDLSERKKQSIDKIISSALLKDLLPRFKENYLKWISNRSEVKVA